MNVRKIIHIDMDAFFASVEQRDNPSLRGKPIAVGHDGPRGVVATASYEARPFGVHSALPISRAKRLCPGLIIVEPRFSVYKEVSGVIQSIFHEFTPLVEALSLDEAFLDVSHHPSATIVAQAIRYRIWEATQLTSSAGVSINKMLAKIASDYKKPNGMFVIPPEDVDDFVSSLPVEKFFGVGKVTADRMHELGIHTGADLRRTSLGTMIQNFGKLGRLYHEYGYGRDDRPVVPHRDRKSVGCENTFLNDTDDRALLRDELHKVGHEAWQRALKAGFKGRTVVLKLKFDDFRQITRSETFETTVDSEDVFLAAGDKLLENCDFKGKKVRLIGLSVTNPIEGNDSIQLTLPF